MATDYLKDRFKEIEGLAYAAGLKPFDIQFFEVPSSVIYEVASYGLPTRYSHWSFGKVYQHQKAQGEMGFSKIYELILNNNPSYAFLDTSNTDIINLMICAHCYLPGTYVQTREDGLKPIEDVREGEWVYGYSGVPRRVVAPTMNIVSDEVVTIQAGSYTFTQTSDHKLFAVQTSAQDRKKYRSWQNAFDTMDYKPKWAEAASLKPGDFLVVSKPIQIADSKLQTITIPIEKTLWKQNIKEDLHIEMDEDFGELVGLFLAEGYARPKGQMGLCFHSEETDLHVRSIELINQCFGLKGRVKCSSQQQAATVEFNEICVAAFLRKHLGHSCYSKQLPYEWIRRSSSEFLRGVLRGFLLGDGDKKAPRSMGFSTTSSVLALQIQQIAMHLGIYFGVYPRDKSTPEQPRSMSFIGSASGIYDQKVRKLLGLTEREISRTWSGVIEDDDHFYVKIQSISTEDYEGVVHCLDVEEDHSFTLANGIVTHNCLGHSDFFANNIMFREADETSMVKVAKRHAEEVNKYRKDYGDDEVDEWLDLALALERHIDVYKKLRRKRYAKRHIEYRERSIGEWEDLHPNKDPLIEKVLEGTHLPPAPEKDILWFLTEYSNLEDWQKRIFEIVRRESYYFYPQYRTKIMNEGWASYWHAELMQQYFLGDKNEYGFEGVKNALTSEEHLDFLASHEKVVQPGVKIPLKVERPEVDAYGRPTGNTVKDWDPRIIENPQIFYYTTRINPYYIGFRMFRDIKDRWDEYYEVGYMEDEWGEKTPVTQTGAEKIREVMQSEDDVSFFRNYLTEELSDKFHLFAYGSPDGYRDDYRIQEEIEKRMKGNGEHGLGDFPIDEQLKINKTLQVRTRDLKDIVNSMARTRNNYGVPCIVVRRVDSDGTLRLEHSPDDRTNVDIRYGEHVLQYVYRVWGRPVEMVRRETDHTHVMRFDSSGFSLDHATSDYPQVIEEKDAASSW